MADTPEDEDATPLPPNTDAEQPYDSGDPQQVNEARKKAGRREKKRLTVIKALMQHKDGRAWVHELLEACDILGNPVELDATQKVDTHLTLYHLGEQNIGKKILMDIEEAALDEYFLMKKEAKERSAGEM